MADSLPAALPSLQPILELATNSVASPHTKRAYRTALTTFLLWCRSAGSPAFTKALVQQYRFLLEERHLSPSSVNIQISAIRRLAAEMADNGLLDRETSLVIARVHGPRRHGIRLGNWLSLQQAQDLLALPDAGTIKGKRDRAALGVLVGAGLRRSELCALRFEHLQQREGRWVLADLIGKHGRVRTVPVPGWCKAAIDLWAETAQLNEGHVFRPLNKSGRVAGDCLTAQSVHYLVKNYGAGLGLHLAPHDLRRTFARLAHKGHAALEQIQISLGHESIVTTERYLGVRQDLTDAPCDCLGIHLLTPTL